MYCDVWCVDVQHVMNMGDEATNMNHQPATAADASPSVTHAHDDVNISEEVSKTGIWHHLNSQPTTAAPTSSQPRHRLAANFTCSHKLYSYYQFYYYQLLSVINKLLIVYHFFSTYLTFTYLLTRCNSLICMSFLATDSLIAVRLLFFYICCYVMLKDLTFSDLYSYAELCIF